MRTFRRTVLAGAVALGLAASGSASAQFTNTYFFGDSLTDAGIYGGARFTINPGLVWSQDLGAQYGFPIKPSNQGGTDYAQGGARVTLPSSATPAGFPQRPVSTQIGELLSATPSLDRNALYSVWIGANDLQQILGAAGAGLITTAQATSDVALAATQTAQQVARLNAAGARYIVVANLPDLGKTPGGQASGPANAAAASQLTGLFNSTLAAGIAQSGVQTIQINIFGLFNEILANPALYGFTNVSGVACTTSSSINCTTSTLVSSTASTYLFADPIHPTPAAHLVVAQVVNSVISAPEQIAVLAEAPLAVERANFRTLDARMVSAINAPRGPGKLESWAAYDYGNPDYKGGYFSGGSNVNTVAVGGDMKVSDRLLAGLQFGYSENRGDSGIANYKLKEPMGTAYVGYGDGAWYLGGSLGAGGLDISTTRNIVLGAATRTESGETRGWQMVGRVLGGYWFSAGNVIHGPTVNLTFQDVRVNAFQENGSDSTTMAFGEQRRRSFITSAGWQVSGQTAGFRPYARATWEHEDRSDLRSVTASTILGGSFTLPAYKADSNYALFSAGVSKDFGNVTGFITGSGTGGKSDGNYYAVTVGLRMAI